MDAKTIRHISSLARIEITEREEKKLQDELSSILGYVEQLNKVNTDNVGPLYQTTGLTNAVREDEHRKDFEVGDVLHDKLIGQAPNNEERYIKVRSILDK
ncbi:hypothetical protein A3H53_02090 [Candidatus Nomurabacteria bacterium RIFCSPLOWO2_02_FULL_40_10]|uniref:Aspartyl/glutamyl-tRNA(Asn/Gln) amidotransferase subunit C n=1 Tax=Candidatus Nomurabacteria bacterium RIFCSPLOWO2_02_FULL_40_10 TaxID=1801786 RepID=A0A1F6XZN7_9BACT|nr:MAG: hypothetical protein A3H53_02090 [Candidatus Nomurabacteria bacterium RIFCSPLOWO2_02_FULL_40_10]